MANSYINFYTNNPTAGGTDGTVVSTDNALTSPITATLDASKAESAAIKCAIRCQSGYKTSGDTTIAFTGTNASKWSIAPDNNYTDSTAALADTSAFSSSLTISTEIDTTNTIFWVKADSANTESPGNDTSVKIVAVSPIIPV